MKVNADGLVSFLVALVLGWIALLGAEAWSRTVLFEMIPGNQANLIKPFAWIIAAYVFKCHAGVNVVASLRGLLK